MDAALDKLTLTVLAQQQPRRALNRWISFIVNEQPRWSDMVTCAQCAGKTRVYKPDTFRLARPGGPYTDHCLMCKALVQFNNYPV